MEEKNVTKKKAADCIICHIEAFRRQHIADERADFAEPCLICPHNKECDYSWLSIMHPLLTDSDLKISMVVQEPCLKQEKPMEERKIEDICVFHWLNCLYQDFLNTAIAGEQFPCTSCPENKNCKSSPPFNFNLAGEKLNGLKVEYKRPKVQE